MCVNINKAFNVLCSQSLCEVVVSSCCRGVTVKVVGCVKICRVAVSWDLSLAVVRVFRNIIAEIFIV